MKVLKSFMHCILGLIRILPIAFLSIFFASGCSGIQIRVFPDSVQKSDDVKLTLQYEATKCVPFISCRYNWSILGGSGWWELKNKWKDLQPSKVTDKYLEFSNIKPSLTGLGEYKLDVIVLHYGKYSYTFTALDHDKYKIDDPENILMECMYKTKYDLKLYSYIDYDNIDEKNTCANNRATGRKIPLKIYHHCFFDSEARKINFPFSQLGIIDLHFNDKSYSLESFVRPSKAKRWTDLGWRRHPGNPKFTYFHESSGNNVSWTYKEKIIWLDQERAMITVQPGKTFTIPFDVDTYESITWNKIFEQPKTHYFALIGKSNILDNIISTELTSFSRNLKFDSFDVWTTYSGISFDNWNNIKEQGLEKEDVQIEIDEKGISIKATKPFPPSVLIVAAWNDKSSGIYPYIMSIQCEREKGK
ncbi:MAG: hypothetical protein ACYDGO_04950 [Smithellaceae bacterium]